MTQLFFIYVYIDGFVSVCAVYTGFYTVFFILRLTYILGDASFIHDIFVSL